MEEGSNRDRVERAAALARLALGEVRSAQLAGELARILDDFAALAAVDVEGIEPLVRPDVPGEGPRSDEVVPSLAREHLLSGAPDPREGFYAVPKTVEDAP